MTAQQEALFDPQFLGRLRTMFFKLRKRRQMKKRGVQPTQSAGFTREFKDRRSYTAGDDFRAIDWRLYARLERLFIRIFEEVQEFHIHILIDRSRSMAEPYPEKRVLSLRLAVALTYLGLVSQHRVSILSLHHDLRRELPPLKGQGHIHGVIERLSGVAYEEVTDLERALREFRPGRDRRGIVFLISDLYGSAPEAAEKALRLALSWPAETHVIHVMDPRERRPDLQGEIRLVEVETKEVRRIWLTAREMDRYAEAFDAFQEGLRVACMRQQMDFVSWPTDQPFEDMFLHLLSRGSALAGA